MDTEITSEEEKKGLLPQIKKHKGLFILMGIVLLVWSFYLFAVFSFSFNPILDLFKNSIKISQKGLFGDSFGALNTLFSGLAFAGVIYAILLQGSELRLQRLQFKESIEAQKSSAIALNSQVEALEKAAKLNANSTLLNYVFRTIDQLPKKGRGDHVELRSREQLENAKNLLIDELFNNSVVKAQKNS